MSTVLHGAQAVAMAQQLLGRPLSASEAHIASVEGYNPETYDDTKGVATTGFGQTGEYSGMPFDQVVSTFEQKTRGLVPNYDSLPQALQLRLLDSTYRGGLSGSPTTLKLANSGNWNAAADEFLNNEEYRLAVESGSGVAGRMKNTSDAMRNYGASFVPPVSDSYTIKSGDNLTKIAAASGLTVDQLVSLNSIQDPNNIQVGQVLKTQQEVPQKSQGVPVESDAGFPNTGGGLLAGVLGGDAKKEVKAQIPKATKDKAKSFLATIFGD